MRYGVVIFDDMYRAKVGGVKKTPGTDGWASIEGSPAKRIKSVSELDSDVKWWTNCEFTDFLGLGLHKHPNILFSGFLRTEMRAIAYDLGCGVDQVSADKSAVALAVVFSRVMRLAVTLLGFNPDGGGMGAVSLGELLSKRTAGKAKMGQEINAAMQHAYQPWTSLTQRLKKDWKSVTLRKPRYIHAGDVLSLPVPGEHRWKYVDSTRLPEGAMERIDWVVGHEMPVLANVIVRPRRGDYSDLISYGAGATVTRSWVCQPELMFLSQYCEIEIVGVFVCEAGYEHQKELDSFPSLGDFSTASFSLGLLMDCFWTGLASPRMTTTAMKMFVPRAAWYRAMDRIILFSDAARLKNAGFLISGYGNGSVLVCYPPGATEDLIAMADEVGLDVPTTKFAEVRTEVRLGADE